MLRHSLFILACCVAAFGHARTPTPDNVDLKLVPRAGSPTLGAFEAGPADEIPDPTENAIRINFAGPEYVDSNGDTWEACNTSAAAPCSYVTWTPAGDGFYPTSNPISGTIDDTLFQTLGAGLAGDGLPLFNIDIAVENGDYTVNLLFAETWRTDQVFHVDLEGVRVLADYNVVDEVGVNAAHIPSNTVTVADGVLSIDLVPIVGGFSPILSGVEVLPLAAPPTGDENPYGLNDVIPSTAHAIPVLLPGANNQCRTGYTCITIPTTCDHVFDVADSEATVETELNNPANGYRYCAPVATDWSTYTIDWTRDCSGETGGRCYLVPDDMATRSQNPYLTASPTLGRFHVDDAAHSLVIAGWKIDNTADTHAGSMIYVDSGETADDIVVAHNECIGLGNASSTGRVSCVEARGDDWIVHSNIAHDSAYKPGVNFDFLSFYGGATTMVHRNSCWDMSGSCLYVEGASPDLFVVNNHFYQTAALRVSNGGVLPFGVGAYLCGGGLIEIYGGGVEATSEGYIYGNILSGARKPEAACGSSATHAGHAISFGGSADAYNVHWNAIYNAHSGIGGIGAGVGVEVGPTDSDWIVSNSGRYLETRADGAPVLPWGELAFNMALELTREEVDTYFADRKNRNNLVQFTTHFAGSVADLQANAYGDHPFEDDGTEYDITQPIRVAGADNDWWDHVIYIMDAATAAGMQVMVMPFTHGVVTGAPSSLIQIVDATSGRIHGRWLADLLRFYTNTIWVMGGDAPPASAGDMAIYRAIAEGINEGLNGLTADTGPDWDVADASWNSWLGTFHTNGTDDENLSSMRYYADEWHDIGSYQTRVVGFYTGHPADQSTHAMAALGWDTYPLDPTIGFEDDWYLTDETQNGYTPALTDDASRRNPYQGLMSGARGFLQLRKGYWDFESGWWDTANNFSGDETYIWSDVARQIITGTEWWELIPDQAIITSGQGTYGEEDYMGASYSSAGDRVVVWFPTSGASDITTTRLTVGTEYMVTWHNTKDGSTDVSGPFTIGAATTQSPPSGWGEGVLVLEGTQQGVDGSTISANVIELGAFGDQEENYQQHGLALEIWGGEEQVYAFNTIRCASTGSSGPFIWETGQSAADLKYNLFIGCDAPGSAAESGDLNLLNTYAANGIDLAVETPAIDDTSAAAFYTNFAVWAGICEHTLADCPVWTFANVVPPVGGVVDDAYPSPSYTPGRGTSQIPKTTWAE